MLLTYKAVFYFFLLFAYTSNLYSQEKTIPTQFSQDGILYQNKEQSSQILAQFKEDERCEVIDYVGNYTYKVKYKDWEGYVKDMFLFVNEDIMDLYFDYEEKQKIKAINEKENRLKKRQDIANQKIRQDSIAKANQKAENKRLESIRLENERLAKLKEQARLDSIAKVNQEAENKRLESIRLENERFSKLKEQARLDSIAKANQEAENKQLEAIRLENERLAKLKEQARLDSIAKVNQEAENKRLESIRLENERLAKLKEQARLDSIAKANQEAENKQLEAIRLKIERLAKLKEQARLDSIAKANQEAENKQLEAIRLENERLAKLKKQARLDSIAKANQEAENKRLEALRLENERLAKLKEQARLDSILKEEDKKTDPEYIKRMKFRNICHYTMNSYDEFYREMIIRTDPYQISKNLNIELYRQGRSINIFFYLSVNLGCASYLSNNRSYIKVKLKNNQTVTLYHSWNLECGEFHFKGKISNSQINILKASSIKSIFFKGTEDSYELTNIDYPEFFMDKLKCIE